jgi:hypothetical protein
MSDSSYKIIFTVFKTSTFTLSFTIFQNSLLKLSYEVQELFIRINIQNTNSGTCGVIHGVCYKTYWLEEAKTHDRLQRSSASHFY